MRFVKNLIATAAMATVALEGVVALPAGNNINPLQGETSLPDTSIGKESTVVPGVSTTASVPDVSSLRSPVITVETTASPSHVATVFEGSDGVISLTGFPPPYYKGMPIHTVTVSDETPTSVPISVTKRVDARQMLPPPKPHLGPEELDDARATYLPRPPVGPGGGRPGEAIEARQMLPITSSAPAAINLRQMLPITSSTPAVISLRQMLPITSSAPAAISLRQMLPITSSTPAAMSLRQMLPLPSSSNGIDGEAKYTSPGTPYGPHPNPNFEERQALPTSISDLEMSAVEVKAKYTSPGTPFGPQPDPGFEARQALPTSINELNMEDVRPHPTNGPHPNPGIDERQLLPTSVTDEAKPTPPCATVDCSPPGDREGAVTTVTETDAHTVTPTTSSSSESTVVITVTPEPSTVTPEPSTVTETHRFTSTVQMPTYTTTDNCTTTTALPSGSSLVFTVTEGSSTITVTPIIITATEIPIPPFPTTNATTSEAGPTVSIPSNGTLTTIISTATVTGSASIWVTSGVSVSMTVAPVWTSTTTATIITTICDHVSCSPSTLTSTLTTSSFSTRTDESATATADAASGSATTSIDTCTETSTSTTSSTSSTSSEESTTQVTVTTHITTTLGSTGVNEVGPPHLTPPPITERDQDPTFSISVPPTNIEDVGPPHLTPPPITRRGDDGPPEAGPLDPRPPFSGAQEAWRRPFDGAQTEKAWVDPPVTAITKPSTLVTSVVRSAA